MTKDDNVRYTPLTNEDLKESGDDESALRENENEPTGAQEESNTPGDAPSVWWYKTLKTLALTFMLSCMALDSCMISPATPDLRQRIGLTMEEFSRSLVARSLGGMIGAVFGGILCDKYPRYTDSLVAGAAAIVSVTEILLPWSRNLPTLALCALLGGLGHGAITPVSNSIVLCLWGSNPVPMYIYHLGWTIGCPISPLLARPFLSPEVDWITNINIVDNGTNISSREIDPHSNASVSPWWEYGDTSKVEIPYALSGFLTLTCVPIFIVYQIRGPPKAYAPLHKSKNTWSEVFSLGSCSQGAKGFSLQIIISILLYYVFYVGSVKADGSLMFSFVIERRNHLNFTKGEASSMQSLSALFHTFGRILAIIFSKWIPIQWLLGASIFGAAVTLTGVSMIGLHHRVMLWVFLCANNVFTATIWAGAYTWAEEYIKVYAIMIGIWDIGANLSGIMFTWLDGLIFDTDHPEYTFFIGTAAGWVFFLHFLIIQINASLYVKRSRKKDTKGETMDILLDDIGIDFAEEELELLHTAESLSITQEDAHAQ